MGFVGGCGGLEQDHASVTGLTQFGSDLDALEESVETALRAASAGSPAVQRSAHAAAAQRADQLLRVVYDKLVEEETFEEAVQEDVAHAQSGKVLRGSFLSLLEERLPRVCELARRASASSMDEWEAQVREELMERISNSAASEYLAPASSEDWTTVAALAMAGGKPGMVSFQLSRGGLVSYTLHLADGGGSLHGEGTWAFQDSGCQSLTKVRLEMRQGLRGKLMQQSLAGGAAATPKQVQVAAKTVCVQLQLCRRVTVEGAVPSDEEEDEDDDEEEPDKEEA